MLQGENQNPREASVEATGIPRVCSYLQRSWTLFASTSSSSQ